MMVTSHSLRRAAHAALLLGAGVALAACGSNDDPGSQKDQAPVEAKAKPAPTPKGKRFYDRDGTLARAEEQAFNAPVPTSSRGVSADNKLAAYTDAHDFQAVVKFYRKNLGNDYNLEMGRGGARFRPKADDGTDVYVMKPQRPGADTRVVFFGNSEGLQPPSFANNPTHGIPSASGGKKPTLRTAKPSGGGSSANPAPSGGGGNSGRPSSGQPSNNGGGDSAGGGGNYDRVVRRAPDGSNVVVMSPKAPAPPTSRNAPSQRGDLPDRPKGGTFRKSLDSYPPGTLF